MTGLVLPLAIVGVVISGIVILAVLLLPSRDSQRTRELKNVIETYARSHPEESQAQSTSALSSLKQHSAARTAALLRERGWHDKLAATLAGAGLTLKPEEFALITAGAAFVGGMALLLLTGTIAAGLLGAFIGVVIPVLVIRIKTNRRESQFLADLPDTLTALASGLSAGASLPQALDTVASEATGPMRDELSRALVNSRLGTPIPDSLDESANRMHCKDLELVVMAMRLQTLHGGNLSELLNTVAATLRERVQMTRHVKALSAEGRLSVTVLMCLPLGVLAFMAIARPDYFSFFISTFPGAVMLAVGACLLTIGYFWSRSIARVEV